MSIGVPSNDKMIDGLALHKSLAESKMKKLLSTVNDYEGEVLVSADNTDSAGNSGGKMIRTASNNSDNNVNTENNTALIMLFSNMLSALNMNGNGNMNDFVNKVSTNSNGLNQQAATKTGESKKDEIKIVSKSVKDSHYQIDISKDIVAQDNKRVYMISCYARDAYLGRYLIKRNYFYTMDREKYADKAYDEILAKVGEVKERYYDGVIQTSGIFTQIEASLSGIISEIDMKEDSLGTTVSR